MIKGLFFIGSALILSACTFPKYNYTSETKNISFPDINQTTTAFVGDEMLSQGIEVTRDVLVLKSDYTIAGFNFSKGTTQRLEKMKVSSISRLEIHLDQVLLIKPCSLQGLPLINTSLCASSQTKTVWSTVVDLQLITK